MHNFLKAYTVQTCRNGNCTKRVILNKNYYGSINKFKCPICLNKPVLSLGEKLMIGYYTQCDICQVYFIIEYNYTKKPEIIKSICYICDKERKKKSTTDAIFLVDNENKKNINTIDTIFLTDNETKHKPISYCDIVSSKYKIIKEDPTIDEWVKHLEADENRMKIYHNSTINWDNCNKALDCFMMNYGFWTIVPKLPTERNNFLNKDILNDSKVLYYWYHMQESTDIFKDIPALCTEYSLVLKTKEYYIYFEFTTYLSENEPINDIGKIENGIGKILYDSDWERFASLVKKEIKYS